MEVYSHREQDTEKLAVRLGAFLLPGDTVFLKGPLGAGKSVFSRALIRSLAGAPDLAVPSPTFTLVQYYETRRGTVYHYDLYRIAAPAEIYELDWEEALSGITLVEWPERLEELAPEDRLDISFARPAEGGDKRIITITPQGALEERWSDDAI